MEDLFNYNVLLNQALLKVRNVRDPRSIRQEYVYYGLRDLRNEHVVSIGGSSYNVYSEMINSARNITVECLKITLFYLFKHYKYEIELVEEGQLPRETSFALVNRTTSSLLLFKEPINDFVIVDPEFVNKEIERHKKCFGVNECRIVYLMYEKAKQQYLNRESLGKGKENLFWSLKDLFDKFFNAEEFVVFRRCFHNYTTIVNEYLGFSVVKNLTPVAQANFAKIVQHRLTSFDYSKLLNIKMHERVLLEEAYGNIRQQYLDNNLYLIMLGNNDFAESLITAEWMYDSMKEAQAIDLTIIGMGYLKSIEQLLYSVVLLHRNENREIKSNNKIQTPYITLDDTNIENDNIDSTIGSLANFCKHNQDIFRSTLPFTAKKYITESIFVFKDIRNGYFHKHNIQEWSKIDEIRNLTYCLAFLLLGSLALTEENKIGLGLSKEDISSDRYRLCEYIHHNAGNPFILCFGEGQEILVRAQRDENARTIIGRFMSYSGAYFSHFDGPSRDVFTNMPNEIYLARIDVCFNGKIKYIPRKVKKIYSAHKFIGPSIFEEVGEMY